MQPTPSDILQCNPWQAHGRVPACQRSGPIRTSSSSWPMEACGASTCRPPTARSSWADSSPRRSAQSGFYWYRSDGTASFAFAPAPVRSGSSPPRLPTCNSDCGAHASGSAIRAAACVWCFCRSLARCQLLSHTRAPVAGPPIVAGIAEYAEPGPVSVVPAHRSRRDGFTEVQGEWLQHEGLAQMAQQENTQACGTHVEIHD